MGYVGKHRKRQILTSDYYDFSSHIVWEWVWQAIRYPDTRFYWDPKNGAFCRHIKNVRGKIVHDEEFGEPVFLPINHPLVSYGQLVSGW